MIEPLDEDEQETVRDKALVTILFFDIKKKTFLIAIITLVVFSLLFQLLPSRFNGFKSFPKDFDSYLFNIMIFWIFVPSFYVIVCLISFVRLKTDLSRKIKRVHNYTITHVIKWGVNNKCLILNNSRFFRVNKYEPLFESLRKGQEIKIKRTATFMLIEYSVKDKDAF